MGESNKTPFSAIYDSFFERVTDEMYMEMNELDVLRDLQGILLNALYIFEFPRFDIFDYEEGYYDSLPNYKGYHSNYEEVPTIAWIGGFFNSTLTQEEINILSLAMVIEWFNRQLAITENTRMRYTGSDFKMTSQANHMAKLKVMIEEYSKQCFHLQRVYKRRIRTADGEIRSTMGLVMTTPKYGINIDE